MSACSHSLRFLGIHIFRQSLRQIIVVGRRFHTLVPGRALLLEYSGASFVLAASVLLGALVMANIISPVR